MTQSYSVRQAQAITPNGVGAIFDVAGQSFVTAGTDEWNFAKSGKAITVRSPRLESLLHVSRLIAPPIEDGQKQDWEQHSGPSLPVLRFPTWLFCGACRSMVQWSLSDEQSNPEVRCKSCAMKKLTQPLVPMRWIQICTAGHMQDVDWVRFVHIGSSGDCKKRDSLKFSSRSAGSGIGSGLGSLAVRCTHCQSTQDLLQLADASLTKRLGLPCWGRHPWEFNRSDDHGRCEHPSRIVQRRAGNVYYPRVHSAIEVPTSDIPASELERSLRANPYFALLVVQITSGSSQTLMAPVIAMIANAVGVTIHEVETTLAKDVAQAAGSSSTSQLPESAESLAEAEWSALGIDEPWSNDDFVARPTKLADASSPDAFTGLQELVSRVTLVDTLREVRALEGFHRVTPGDSGSFVRVDGRRFHDLPRPTWLPAIEVRGEGIFLSLNEEALRKWEENDAVMARAETLSARAKKSFMWSRLADRTGPVVTARYVLLHTLAHTLIRRLAFESGYGAASLRERVYARSNEAGRPTQGGVLIYTAAGDAEGTLGGLVRQGEMPRLARTVMEGLGDASWCSSDPLCSEQSASSLNGMNLAACHACLLVSETSCENGNFLLDRAMMVGLNGMPGFFEHIIAQATAAAVGKGQIG
jgi:hypothetical protein